MIKPVKLTQPVVRRSPFNLPDLFVGCQKMSSMMNIINKGTKRIYDDPVLNALYEPEKWKGDVFEAWVEFILKSSPCDNRLGIYDYNLVLGEDDHGVDGLGFSLANGFPASVQVKFRSKTNMLLTANEDHISNFVANSLAVHNVPQTEEKNMLIVTTAKGLHPYTQQTYGNKVRTLGIGQLRRMYDNLPGFWNQFRESLEYSK